MKKKGFTLVELLAVIVILAVISLITIPLIGNVIEDSRKKAFEITCNEVYRSHEQYEILEAINGSTSSCTVFDFGSNREKIEIIDGIKYEPISKLSLKGELPNNGYMRICEGKIELKIDNGKYTCIKDENRTDILGGKVEENDTTVPLIENVSLSSKTNSIRVVVRAIEEDGEISKYYYSKNGEEYIESVNHEYTFEGLEEETEYEIKVVVENGSGLRSEEYAEKITTKEIINPEIDETNVEIKDGYTWATERELEITYKKEEIENPEYYFRSSIEAIVEEGTVVGECGLENEPGECTSSNITILEANKWYKTEREKVKVTYTEEGTIYALVSDGTNISGTSTWEVSNVTESTPNAPVITGGTSAWSTSPITISVSEESETTGGIAKYQYYISTSETGQENGSWQDCTVSDKSHIVAVEGTRYIYFKAIGNNGKESPVSNVQTTMVDTIDPTISVSVSGKVATLTLEDNVGVIGYGISDSVDTEPTYIEIESTENTSSTWEASAAGTYVAWIKDNAGNINHEEFTIDKNAFGQIVTYTVDRNSYTELVYNGSSVLSPTTFTPAKSGYEFVGWREDTTASSTVLTEKTMSGSPMTLYAVFKKVITLTIYNGSTTATQLKNNQYYNNGNIVNPTFTVSQTAINGWNTRGWSTATTGNAGVTYSSINNTTISSNTTLYGLYYQTIYLYYNGNGSTSGSTATQNGTRYYNSAGNYTNPTFTLSSNGFARTNCSFSKWAIGSASGTQYAVGAKVTLSTSTTFFATWTVVPNTWIKSGWSRTDSWTSGKYIITPSLSATSSAVTAKFGSVTSSSNDTISPTLQYDSPWIDLTEYKTLSLAGVDVNTGGGTDYYRNKIYLIDASGNATLIFSGINEKWDEEGITGVTESGFGEWLEDDECYSNTRRQRNFSTSINVANRTGNYKLRITVSAYGMANQFNGSAYYYATSNRDAYLTLTKASLN